MSADFRQLMAKPVIRLEDVSALRAHIELRHPDQDSHLRAEMMAEGINRMLEASLTGLDSVQKDAIKKKLITEQLIGNRQSILKLDVLNRIMALDINPDHLVAKAWGWYVLNTGHSVTLTDFVEQASPYLPHRVREAIKNTELRNLAYQPAARLLDAMADVEAVMPDTLTERTPPEPSAFSQWLSDASIRIQERMKRITTYRLTKKGQLVIGGTVCIVALVAFTPQLISMIPQGGSPSATTSPVFVPPLEYKPLATTFYSHQTPLDKPSYLRYQNISLEKLKVYLERKSSMLLTQDYLEQLLNYSYEKDLNPLLLIAIIGQEQNYVPSQHRFAPQMIQNPFNIYGSWETHPVGFTASMKEACYTINSALAGRTLYVDPFVSINSRYAQDPRWYLGVKVIFRDLMAVAGE